MDNFSIAILATVIVLAVGGVYIMVYIKDKKALKNETKKQSLDASLQLQAYERLTILTERISLKGLISRLSPANTAAVEYQSLLIETIKQEFDYNLSQQLYVSQQAWQAIGNLKEQNIFILHQLIPTLPPDATGLDLSKRVIELLDADPKISLHTIVLEALRHEARQVMVQAG